MGFRFHKTIRILPGIRLNVSKTGTSVSIGGRGASVNIGKRGVTRTIGIPGTGISHRQTIRRPHADHHAAPEPSDSHHTPETDMSSIIGFVIAAVILYALWKAYGGS